MRKPPPRRTRKKPAALTARPAGQIGESLTARLAAVRPRNLRSWLLLLDGVGVAIAGVTAAVLTFFLIVLDPQDATSSGAPDHADRAA